ncbi:MAG: hypothetical protein HY911_04320 [Desulfobacterales bacterium]|nr:hypothetical protein [Desulfobacterales bacterium]
MSYSAFWIRMACGMVFWVAMAVCGSIYGCAGWSAQEKAGQAVYTALHLADWAQTRQIAAEPEKYHENNPYLGEHPSTGKVDLYMGATLAAHCVVSDLLPHKWTVPLIHKKINPRALWQYLTIGIEAGCVASNYSLGLRGEF